MINYQITAEKDVWRTDRNHTFYEGLNNPNICIMLDILMTHCMYNFDLGYVQGMSDLLSPILLIMEHEVDAFWCFTGFTKLISQNFDKDQQSMKNQLFQLQFLIKFLDPHFSDYLDKNESFSMTFCFRWLLILFKREFSFPDIMYLWEVFDIFLEYILNRFFFNFLNHLRFYGQVFLVRTSIY